MKVIENDERHARLECGHVVQMVPFELWDRHGWTGLRCRACRYQVSQESFLAKRFASLKDYYAAKHDMTVGRGIGSL